MLCFMQFLPDEYAGFLRNFIEDVLCILLFQTDAAVGDRLDSECLARAGARELMNTAAVYEGVPVQSVDFQRLLLDDILPLEGLIQCRCICLAGRCLEPLQKLPVPVLTLVLYYGTQP